MALHIPVKEQKWNFAKRLVELGADVNEVDVNGLSVLHVIVTQKIDDGKDDCTAFINLLLTKGVNLTARTPGGDSVFHLAARHDNWEIIEQILTQVTDGIEHVDEPDSEGFTILHRLAIKKNRGGRNTLLLQFLLDNGAKCDTLCPSGDSAMHLAVKHGNWGILHVLLCYHIGIQSVSTSTNKQWLSPCITVNQSDEKPGGNLNIKDTFGNTVLHLCAKAEAWQQVNTLLKCGADASLTDDEGDTVLNRLFKARNVYTAETEEFFDTIIQIVARNKNVIVFDKLLDHLDDLDMTDSDGLTILHRVVQCMSSWSLDIVRTLIQRKVDIKIPDPKGDTALHFAAQCGRWDIVGELLENGVRADNTDSQGVSVLHRLLSSLCPRLCQNGTYNSNKTNLSLVKLMVISGLDTYTKDEYSNTVIQLLALDEREWEVILFFFESEAEKISQLLEKEREIGFSRTSCGH
ncbi:uncharacterized protein LOC112559978 [Pomacea canaliculata]|uniref:uncharacterized protein LOC112559978 n=1 Tax=Pomacea canaliculata TaxID=400727 RepID=UPI000D7368B3|nr:uncharacterized protein LOC112559978 [Pomacea canaliculata]XP_025087294.1 uncharacterized protein LOC112559978 [Pomacea canaliculata]XP_025087295.1 uncharacterized protein LOC112559978 [Pomacea canaliculata]